ncbi:hypothetical protein BKA62DRAFT_501357 [Auriculariales sp. MPI-PUGE-AT-0066]|nr:hypothetical protein BKA62DRAFT_501357 [Auriculariales sp. MPI-PUGE-AT-0066]
MSFTCPQDALKVEDDDLRLAWYPTNHWKRGNAPKHTYSGGTLAISRLKNAQFSVTLNASYIWYYADTNKDHGKFSVELNGHQHSQGTSVGPRRDNQLLWESSLDLLAEQKLTFKSLEAKYFNLDVLCYLPVNLEVRPNITTPQEASQSPSASMSASPLSLVRSNGLQVGAIFGIVCGAMAFFGSIIIISLILRDRRRKRNRSQFEDSDARHSFQQLRQASIVSTTALLPSVEARHYLPGTAPTCSSQAISTQPSTETSNASLSIFSWRQVVSREAEVSGPASHRSTMPPPYAR